MSGIAVSTTINGDDAEFMFQFEETPLEVLRDHPTLAGNLCRWTGRDNIVRAVQDAASVTKGA